MRYPAFLFILSLFLYSCETSEPQVDGTNVEVVKEVEETDIAEENEEETEEEDRWVNYVYSSMTIQPYYYPSSDIAYSTDTNGWLKADIIEGDKLVFYYYEAAGDKIDTITGQRLADSGYKKELLFAIEMEKTEFKLEKENFSTALAKYNLHSNIPEKGYFDVTDGTIEGVRINEKEWDITTNILWTIPANEDHADIHQEFQLSANFIPAPEN